MKTDDLRGKVAAITGASSGIGRATALALADAGVNLVLAARGRDALQHVEQEAKARGVDTLTLTTDVAVREKVTQLIEKALAHFGRIDIFVANAGTYFRRPVRDLQIEDIEHVMAVNFYGALYGILGVLPHMLERKSGHIVVVSSLDGKKGIPPDGAYVASKFAMAGLAEVLRQELRGTGVYVTTVFPGRIDTPMIAHVVVPSASPKVPPEQVANAIVRGIVGRRAEVIVPHLGGKVLVILNAFSAGLGDWFVRTLKLPGQEDMAQTTSSPTR